MNAASVYAGAFPSPNSDTCGELAVIAEAFEKTPEFLRFLAVPGIKKEDKYRVLDNIFKENVSKETLNLLKVLVKNDRTGLFFEVKDKILENLEQHSKIMKVTVVTTRPLSELQISKIREKLELKFNKKVNLVNTVDRSVLGGILLKMGNTEIDYTLKNRLDSIAINLKGKQ